MAESIGFTGSREITPSMAAYIDGVIAILPVASIVVTGGCIGVDAYVATRAHARGLHVHTILPADRSRVDPDWRSHCTTVEAMPQGTSYRSRNVRLVMNADRLYAIPRWPEMHSRSRRSGTWQTVR